MSTHTRGDIEATTDYDCAMGDCGHDQSPCPTELWDCCQECSARNWDESEGGIVTWDECGGTGAFFAEVDAEPTVQDQQNRSE